MGETKDDQVHFHHDKYDSTLLDAAVTVAGKKRKVVSMVRKVLGLLFQPYQ